LVVWLTTASAVTVFPILLHCDHVARHTRNANDVANDVADDLTIQTRARADLRRWFPQVDLQGWRTLAVVRTPRSQFRQPPHVRTDLPSTRTLWPGLYLAGELSEDSSLNGAMRSGEAAANDVQAHLLESAAGHEESRA
jgi:Flavin containing amine oxidoreductase